MRTLVSNKKAFFDYEILEKIEAGIVLKGWEVKSLKAGHANITSAFIREKEGELYITGMRIPVWKTSNYINKEEEDLDRKLLLRKNEIIKIAASAKQDRLTIIPLEIISNNRGLIKVIIALVRGKKRYDKRQKIKEREEKRRIEQDRKQYNF